MKLEKLKNKVKAELAKAEARIVFVMGRRHRPKQGDSKEIEQLKAEISNLETKYKEILDSNWVIYKQKKQPTPSTLENDNFASLTQYRLRKIALVNYLTTL